MCNVSKVKLNVRATYLQLMKFHYHGFISIINLIKLTVAHKSRSKKTA